MILDSKCSALAIVTSKASKINKHQYYFSDVKCTVFLSFEFQHVLNYMKLTVTD